MSGAYDTGESRYFFQSFDQILLFFKFRSFFECRLIINSMRINVEYFQIIHIVVFLEIACLLETDGMRRVSHMMMMRNGQTFF